MPPFPSPSVILRTSPGSGLVARRPAAMLFLPCADRNAEILLDAFTSAPPGAELQALGDAVIDQAFHVPPFACITLSEAITVRVLGDLSVTSDAPSLPRLSARCAETWVDHTLPRRPESLVIEAGEPPTGSRTDLVEGIAHAGGFSLVATSGAEPLAAVTSEERPADCVEPTLDPFDLTVLPAPQPSVELSFEDGSRVGVDGEIIIGRNPLSVAGEQGAVPWMVEDERISRAHLSVTVTGAGVTIEDLGSRNGTLHLAPGSPAPIPLAPGRPTAVEAGTIVYLGSTSFTVGAGR